MPDPGRRRMPDPRGQKWLLANHIRPLGWSGSLAEVLPDDLDDVARPLDDVLVGELDDAPPPQAESGGALVVALSLTTGGVGAVPGELDDQSGCVPEQVDAGDAPAVRAPLDLGTGPGQPGGLDEANGLLLEPGVAERSTLRAVEEGVDRREAGPSRDAVAPQQVDVPPRAAATTPGGRRAAPPWLPPARAPRWPRACVVAGA